MVELVIAVLLVALFALVGLTFGMREDYQSLKKDIETWKKLYANLEDLLDDSHGREKELSLIAEDLLSDIRDLGGRLSDSLEREKQLLLQEGELREVIQNLERRVVLHIEEKNDLRNANKEFQRLLYSNDLIIKKMKEQLSGEKIERAISLAQEEQCLEPPEEEEE